MDLVKKKPSFEFEKQYWNCGYKEVIGADEVGRGAFAGPVTAAAVIFSSTIFEKLSLSEKKLFEQINDSKLLTPEKRQLLSVFIKQIASAYEIATIPVGVINRVGIGKATTIAFRKAISRLLIKTAQPSCFLLVDGFHIHHLKGMPRSQQHAIIKGDQKSITIAAASIIAKVHRDNLMRAYHAKFISYDFKTNKGYGTKAHQQAIKKFGLCSLHRTSFDLRQFVI